MISEQEKKSLFTYMIGETQSSYLCIIPFDIVLYHSKFSQYIKLVITAAFDDLLILTIRLFVHF